MAITKEYIVVEEIDIDFLAKDPAPIVICPQFEDRGRAIKVKLKNGGEDFAIEEGLSPYVYESKFDGKVVGNPCEYEGNVVMIEITRQMAFVSGNNLLRVALVREDGAVAQTMHIVLKVISGPNIEEAERSTDEFKALEQYVVEAGQYAAQAEQGKQSAAQSEQNAEASKTAAQAALQGALEAEDRVQAIVAGNEAYTKQQSHDLFALALRGTAEAAKSITIHPDAGSNVVVTAHGFTKQAGTGDPSPTNVRALTNGGLKLVELVLTGAENWSVSGTTYPRFYFTLSKPAPANWTNTVACTIFKPSNILNEENKPGIGAYGTTLYLRESKYNGSVEVLKADLSAKYAAGVPVKAWYVPADESQATGLYAPIIGTGGEYSAKCVKINDHLCAGDKFISRTLSGCDESYTFDGSDDEVWGTEKLSGNVIRYWIKLDSNIAQADSANGFALANWLTLAVTGGTGNASLQNVFTITADQRLYVRTTNETLDEFKAKLKANPLFVCCRTTGYTAKNDKEVAMETHVRYRRILDGTESYYEYRKEDNTETYFGFSTGLRPYNPSTDGNNGISSHFKFGGATSQGYYPNCFVTHSNGDLYIRTEIEGVISPETMKEYAKSQFDAESPMTFVYKLATPITYAHEPVDFIASPDEDGTLVITGEADGTVSAEYNKDITYAFTELQSAILALGANLSL